MEKIGRFCLGVEEENLASRDVSLESRDNSLSRAHQRHDQARAFDPHEVRGKTREGLSACGS